MIVNYEDIIMKRIFALLLAIVMVFLFSACKRESLQPPETTEQGEQSAAADNTEQEAQSSSTDNAEQEGAAAVFTPVFSVTEVFELKHFTPPNSAGEIHYLFHEPLWKTGKDYPLVIFLHGLGDTITTSEMGSGTYLVDSLIDMENESEKYAAYTLIPITPLSGEGWWKDWQFDFLQKLIFDLVENYNIDAKRIYVTGLSMGGFTTCRLVNAMPPDTFAAAVPLSGANNLTNPDAHHNTAFRIYHVASDTTVNVESSRSLYQQLRASQHPKAEYYELTSGTHTSPMHTVYSDRLFMGWLFTQRLP